MGNAYLAQKKQNALRTRHHAQTLERAPQLITTFLEISSEVIWSYDFGKNEYYWLASTDNQKKYGIPDQDGGQFWPANLYPPDAARAQSGYESAAKDPSVTQFQHHYFFYGANRDLILIEDKMKFIRDEQGLPKLVVGVWRDITADRTHQEYLEDALQKQKVLNEELEVRQKKIEITQEELKQTNEQLSINYQQLSEREFILNLSQRLAKIGSWEYEYATGSSFWSEEMYNIYGLDKSTNPDDMDFLLTLFEPESRKIIENIHNSVVARSNQDFDVTVQIITPLGYRKWLRIAGFSLENKVPSDRLIGVAYDVTYFKEAEARLRSSEEKFSKAFNGNPDPMLIVRRSDMKIIDANTKILPVLGYSQGELIGREVFNTGIFSADEYSESVLRAEFSHYSEFECSLRAKDGSTVYGLVSWSTIYIEGIANYILAIKDISERKVAEEKLRLSEANLKATINNTSVMVWSVDRDLRYVMMNAPFLQYIEKTYGYLPKEGMRIMPDGDDPAWLTLRNKWEEFYKRALSGETFSLTEERFGKQLTYSLNPIIENGKVMGVSIFAEDVSEKLQQQHELANAHRALAEYKLIALRSVMNPHFIFNALNSIQYFITKNDRLNAINYLSTFSKLIRGILNNSKNGGVKLVDEIELLKNYVQLEMLRFENKFEFILDVDPLLDLENIEVQSLIVQPFVENAILHGLYNSDRQGLLRISILNDEPAGILFVIEDNGVGRQAARALREKNTPAHKSVGISLTEERLQLINRNKDVSVHIEDLFDSNGATGTKVNIWVKV